MTGRVSVGALGATYLVAAGHPAENEVRLRLDAVARRLDGSLAAPLERLAAGREDEVWLFRRLDADVALDLAWDDETLARAWADGVAASLASRLGARRQAPAPPVLDDGVVCFADRTDQLAALVADLAAGTAWSRWWHDEFGGLRHLPTPAAIAGALTRTPARGRAALGRLAAAGRLAAVAVALGERGCTRVVDALYAEAAPEPADPGEAAPHALDAGLPAESAVLLACVAAEAMPAPAASAPPHSLASSDGAAAPPGTVDAVARRPAAAPATSGTPLGGAFLLLRGLGELFAELDPATRLLALRSALGAERATESGFDSVLATAAGIPADGGPSLPGTDIAGALVRSLLARGRTDGTAVALVPTDHGRVVLDVERDVWLGLGDGDEVDAALRTIAEVTGRPPALVEAPGASAGVELGYFALPDASPVVAVAGRALLRELAHRLGGFERSMPRHLWRNVLDRPARVEVQTGRTRVELGPAPLDVMLRLAGIDGERFDVPWLGEVELMLAS